MGVDLSEVLPALLEAKGMTQERLGELAGIKRTDINLIAKGRSVGPARLRRIADALEVEIADLEGMTQPGVPKNPLRAELAEIKAKLEAMDRRREGFRSNIARQLTSQSALLAELGVVQDRLDLTASTLVTVAERLDRASEELAKQAARRRPA